jgi:hypothetical protein
LTTVVIELEISESSVPPLMFYETEFVKNIGFATIRIIAKV